MSHQYVWNSKQFHQLDFNKLDYLLGKYIQNALSFCYFTYKVNIKGQSRAFNSATMCTNSKKIYLHLTEQ